MIRQQETFCTYRVRKIEEHFKRHSRSVHETGIITMGPHYEYLEYAEPGTVTGRVRYMLVGGVLTVSGDYGYAVYRFGANTLQNIAEYDYGYFREKCEASEVGRYFDQWYPELAWRYLSDYFAQEECEEGAVAFFELESEIKASCDSQHEWCAWLEANGDRLFGQDWTDFCSIGSEAAIRCILHLGGLRKFFGIKL